MDFLDHLNEDGLLTIVAHGRFEVYRLVSIAFKVLEDKGFSPQEIMRHMAVVEGAGHSGLPVFILGKTSFTDEQARLMYAKSRGLGFVPAYLPYIDGVTLDPLLKALADGKVSLDYLISLAPFDMRPPTDDSPFFYKFERGVPPTLLQFMIGAMALSAVVSFLYVGGRRRRQSVARNKELPSHLNKLFLFKLYFFASLGLGFMLIEISLIQRFILFLGHPTPAIAASLFSLLLACGLGSFYSRRWNNNKLYNAFKASLVIGSIAILYMFTLPYLLNVFLSYDTGLRFLFSFVLIFPLGFAMGIPFPTGLRFFGKEPDNDVAWMWCINGVFSVLGSILAMIIAMSFGFSGVLLLGGLTYFGVFLVGRTRAAML